MKREWIGPVGIAIFLLLIGLWYYVQFTCNGPKSDPVPPRPSPYTAVWDSACAHGDTLTSERLIGGCYICEIAKDRLNPVIDTINAISVQRTETAVYVHMIGEDRQYERCVKTNCKQLTKEQ